MKDYEIKKNYSNNEYLKIMKKATDKLEAQNQPSCLGVVIWRCVKDITNIHGETIFTKGLVYEQVNYPMMLINNKTEESEVSNLEDYFTSI